MTGLSTAQGVHRDPSTSSSDDGGLLAHVVGTQLDDHRYADQTQRDGQGRSSSTLLRFRFVVEHCTVYSRTDNSIERYTPSYTVNVILIKSLTF